MTCAYTPDISPSHATARRPQASGGPWPLAHRPESAGEARKITQKVLTQWRVADEAADSVLLTVSELVTNAVEHAQPPLNLNLSRDPGTRRVHIEISDGGPAATDGDWAANCARGEHGRGLEIIDHLTAAHGDRQEFGDAIHWADVNGARLTGSHRTACRPRRSRPGPEPGSYQVSPHCLRAGDVGDRLRNA
ncbi:ATP-binding protein [Streptantibioticus ferralitis]|uniref:ATP-binding protein n=1 Tax=Streptantibioticus ferralitis TaxID=236510 RepID=A0ABT5ZCI3_9ACTN|nr:ATP-binding protein [Streptantibioticus ferralitis]MDF2261403.1 ATP-binding protein [Streptantibioticus ferralitis]